MQRQNLCNSCVMVATILFVAASGVMPNQIHASERDQKEIAPVGSGSLKAG